MVAAVQHRNSVAVDTRAAAAGSIAVVGSVALDIVQFLPTARDETVSLAEAVLE